MSLCTALIAAIFRRALTLSRRTRYAAAVAFPTLRTSGGGGTSCLDEASRYQPYTVPLGAASPRIPSAYTGFRTLALRAKKYYRPATYHTQDFGVIDPTRRVLGAPHYILNLFGGRAPYSLLGHLH